MAEGTSQLHPMLPRRLSVRALDHAALRGVRPAPVSAEGAIVEPLWQYRPDLSARGLTYMELHEYLHILRRRWVSAIVVVLAAGAVTFSMTKQYTATTQLFFAVSGSETTAELAQGSKFVEKQMASLAQVATSPLVLDPVIRDLDLATTASELAKSLSATVSNGTVVLDVSATSPDPEQAVRIANAIGFQLSKVASQLTPERPDGSG